MDNKLSRLWDKITGKNNKKDMVSEEKLISYKQNFTGQKFQWIKTQRPELIGKVVTCRDIKPQGNSLFAIFDDGSSIIADKLNSDLMMIHGQTPPMTKEEVQSLRSPVPVSGTLEPPPGAKPLQHTPPAPSSKVNTDPVADSPKVHATIASPSNPFEMFNSDETDLSIKIRIKLPDKKLLKMMYNNAEDKAKFLDQLSDYVQKSLSRNVVKESLTSVLDPKTKPKPVVTVKKEITKEPEIKLTEINGE